MEGTRERIRVLIADDHPLFRDALERLLLNEQDIEVVGQACDGEEAVKLAGELLPDVAVIDAAMPKIDGIEVTRQIKAISRDVAILIISAFGNESYVFGAIEVGAEGYLLKTARGQELVNAIRAVHDGKTVLDPVAAQRIFERAALKHVPTDTYEVPGRINPRELEVLKLAAKGLSNKAIAQTLAISVHTVQAHLVNIFSRLGVDSRTEAVGRALKGGWITLDDLP